MKEFFVLLLLLPPPLISSNASGLHSIFQMDAPARIRNREKLMPGLVRLAGSVLTLKCQGIGNPRPKAAIWYLNGKPFRPEERIGDSKVRRWSLELDSLRDSDKGNYTCVVHNSIGNDSWTTNVDVAPNPPPLAPIIVEPPSNVTVEAGKTAVMTCRATSHPTMHTIWVRHMKTNGTPTSYVNLKDVSNVVFKDKYNERIEIANVTSADVGQYTCSVVNTHGASRAEAFLTLAQLPSGPVGIHVISTGFLTALIFLSLGLLVTSIGFGIQYRKYKTKRKQKDHFIVMRSNSLYGGDEVSKLWEEKWELDREGLLLGQQIGEGAFGKVVRAKMRAKSESVIVAVKMLKDDATERELRDLIQEVKIMKSIGHHPNIINLIGCCTKDGPLYVVVEYADNGNLRDFLRAQRDYKLTPICSYEKPVCPEPLSMRTLVEMSHQIARGMEYISSKKIVHRDLAARNVLVNKNMTVMIADFGLTRDVSEHEYYRKTTNGRLPVKWMAPESLLDRKYSSKSDVWSFGVLLWEIFALGANPYPTVPVENLYQLLRAGHRMEPPLFCKVEVYGIMLLCWKFSPKHRPTFVDLLHMLERLLDNEVLDADYLNLEVVRSQRLESQFDLPGLRTPRPSDSQYSSCSSSIHESIADVLPATLEGSHYVHPATLEGSHYVHPATLAGSHYVHPSDKVLDSPNLDEEESSRQQLLPTSEVDNGCSIGRMTRV